MIAVSDALLIVVSAGALCLGLYQWQGNIEQATVGNTDRAVATQPQGDLTRPSTAQNESLTGDNVGSNGTVGTATDNPQLVDTQNNTQPQDAPVVVDVQPSTATINVANDSETTASNEAVVDVPPFGSYTVQAGDSLSLIAEQYGTTVSTLQEINGIQGSLINVGQVLRYPQSAN